MLRLILFICRPDYIESRICEVKDTVKCSFVYLLTEKDCREWKLTTVDPQERSTWRSGVRSAMHAASQLPGKGPTDVDDAPAPAR